MVKQYLQFCKEEQFEALRNATLFCILSIKEASQQKSLSGLDNTAVERSAGFQRLYEIVDELDQAGLDNSVSNELWEDIFQK